MMHVGSPNYALRDFQHSARRLAAGRFSLPGARPGRPGPIRRRCARNLPLGRAPWPRGVSMIRALFSIPFALCIAGQPAAATPLNPPPTTTNVVSQRPCARNSVLPADERDLPVGRQARLQAPSQGGTGNPAANDHELRSAHVGRHIPRGVIARRDIIAKARSGPCSHGLSKQRCL